MLLGRRIHPIEKPRFILDEMALYDTWVSEKPSMEPTYYEIEKS
jgi:hypothetical protein